MCSIWFAFELISFFLGCYWHPTLVVAAAVPVGVILSTWMHFLLQLIWPLGSALSCFVICLQCVIGHAFRARKRRRVWWKMPRTFYFFVGSCVLLFGFACHCTFLRGGLFSQGTAYSDLPFHMNLVSSFAFGANSNRTSFWPFQTPFYAGETLVYPIIPDFHAATLLASGASMRMSMLIPSLGLLLSLTIALYHLAMMFTNVRYVPEIATALFFLAGGSGWRVFFDASIKWNETQGLNTNYIHYLGTHNAFWIHPLMHFLLPQRSAMFSMPLCVVTVIALQHCTSRVFLFMCGFFVSLMPMVSGHSFLTMCLYAGFVALFDFPWLQPRRWINSIETWLRFALPILLLGIPQCAMFVRRASHGSKGFMEIEAIWDRYHGMVNMWWESLSIFVCVALVHSWLILNRTQRKMYAPAFFVFILANFVRFQPVPMDNTKVFIAGWYPMACSCVGLFFARLIEKGHFLKVISVLLAAGSVVSGIMCICKSLAWPFDLFSSTGWQCGLWSIENTPVDAIFLTGSFPATPPTCIAGRIGFVTYIGWVVSHGISPDHMQKSNEMWTSHAPKTFRDNNVKYIYHDSSSGRNLTISRHDPEWLNVFHTHDADIWELVSDVSRPS